VGEWTTIGNHPQVPDSKLRGRTHIQWHESGAFLVMHSEVDHPEFPDGVAIIGSDNATGRFSMIYFDERGVSRIMDVTVSERSVTWEHDDPKFAQRLTIVAEPTGERMTSKGTMSQNRGPWTDDLSQLFVRRK
jgi:hypothetical protein